MSEKTKLLLFTAIGFFNTAFDVVLYFIFFHATHSIVIANVIATSIALAGSYLLNSRLLFKTKKWTTGSIAGFVVVTIFGLWFLQTAAIYAITHYLYLVPESLWRLLRGQEHFAKSVVPKLAATGITMVWNYLWYNKVIFKGEKRGAVIVTALDEL